MSSTVADLYKTTAVDAATDSNDSNDGVSMAVRSSYVLAIDTATTQMAIAIGRLNKDLNATSSLSPADIDLVASADRPAPRQANISLLPTIDEMLKANQIEPSDIAAVVSGLGPGSFTGVRIALATAKGIARGLGVPLYGVPTLDAIAFQAWSNGIRGKIAVVADAMRHEIYPARYELFDDGPARLDHLTVSRVEQTIERWGAQLTPLFIMGDGLAKYSKDFLKCDVFYLADESLWSPTGHGLLLAFAASFKEQRSKGEAGTVLPIYTRLSDAEENERARLVQGGQIAQGAEITVPASGVIEPVREDGFHLRPMAMQDVPAVAELEELCFPPSQHSGECWGASVYRSELFASDRSWWVAWQNDQLVGFAGGWLIDGDMHILKMAVHPDCRRRGLGSTLLKRLLEDAFALNATSASLEVRISNQPAIALYKNHGFKEAGVRPGYYSPKFTGAEREDAFILKKTLDSRTSFSGETQAFVDATRLPDDEVFSDAFDLAAGFEAPLILAIETSCDETAAAVITGDGQLISNVVATQVDYHARFGGVVPEIASRKHTEAIVGVVDEAMSQAGLAGFRQLDALAVTYAPGLIGALVVGVAFAKGLAWSTGLPLVRVNHMEGHIYANRFVKPEEVAEVGVAESAAPAAPTASATFAPAAPTAPAAFAPPKAASAASAAPTAPAASAPKPLLTLEPTPEPPFVIALLSGGHTMLVLARAWGDYEVLGQTLDDAVGEAFDKVAKAMGLGYPGGPVISRLALDGDPKAIDFPRALMHSHDLSFSLSGLKTAVITWIRQQAQAGIEINMSDVAASFQQAVVDVQVAKALTACQQTGAKTFCLGGGVAANSALRDAYQAELEKRGIHVRFPLLAVCSDNAAMIAAVALDRFARRNFMSLDGDAQASADLSLKY